jgi:hypothetical protein
VRRHKKTGSGSTDVPDDEQLLVRCGAALTAIGPSG